MSKKNFTSSVSRRDFLHSCATVAGILGLPALSGTKKLMAAVKSDNRPPVIWLHFQECTGDSESLLRASHPDVASLILDLISLDYHETLMAASGYQAEKSLHDTMKNYNGKYILVVEGSIPVKDGGIYCQIAGKTALSLMKEVAQGAAAIIAVGSCASWGGPQSKAPNPTGATGVKGVLPGKTVISLPGCPVNPYIFLSTVLYYLTFKRLPALDKLGRPKFGYGHVLHQQCERRAHFDAGRFVTRFGDQGHQQGWCLYLMGCKGPITHANCNAQRFNDVGVWPVSAGHPCVGCTESHIAFEQPIHQVAKNWAKDAPKVIDEDLLSTYPKVGEKKERGIADNVGSVVAGVVIGTVAGFAGALAAKLPHKDEEDEEQNQ